MDPATAVYAPAIKIDYNVHMMENLNISGNMADGLQVMHNDVYSNARLIGSLVENNLGNGVTVRGSFFELFNCTLRGNGKAGFEYNPAYSTYEALQIRAGVHDFVSFDRSLNIILGDHEVKWFLTPQRFTPEGTTYDMEIAVNQYQRVSKSLQEIYPCLANGNLLNDLKQGGLVSFARKTELLCQQFTYNFLATFISSKLSGKTYYIHTAQDQYTDPVKGEPRIM